MYKSYKSEVDQSKRAKQVEEITDSDYFKNLQGLAKKARNTIPLKDEKAEDNADNSLS